MGVMHKDSTNGWLSTFEVGERRYTETTAEGYDADMRRLNSPRTRRPEVVRDMVFSVTLFVAVRNATDIRHLLCTERIS